MRSNFGGYEFKLHLTGNNFRVVQNIWLWLTFTYQLIEISFILKRSGQKHNDHAYPSLVSLGLSFWLSSSVLHLQLVRDNTQKTSHSFSQWLFCAFDKDIHFPSWSSLAYESTRSSLSCLLQTWDDFPSMYQHTLCHRTVERLQTSLWTECSLLSTHYLIWRRIYTSPFAEADRFHWKIPPWCFQIVVFLH